MFPVCFWKTTETKVGREGKVRTFKSWAAVTQRRGCQDLITSGTLLFWRDWELAGWGNFIALHFFPYIPHQIWYWPTVFICYVVYTAFATYRIYITTLFPSGEGDGTPLQYSCLENPMDGGAWWAAVHGVGVRHDWATSLSLFTFMHWRRKWQPTPVFLPGESQGRGSLVGCRLWSRTESDTTEVT